MCTYHRNGREARIIGAMFPEVAGQELLLITTNVANPLASWEAPRGCLFVWMHNPETGKDTLLTVPSVVFNDTQHHPQNKLDPAIAERYITKETYTLLPSGKCLVCELTLANGYVCSGKSLVIDPSNFIFERARDSARRRAMEELFTVIGYAKQDIVHKH